MRIISSNFSFVLIAIVCLATLKVDGAAAPAPAGYGLLGGLSTSSSNYYSSTSGLYNSGYTSVRPPYYNSYSTYNRPGGYYGYNSYNGYRPGGGYYSGGGGYGFYDTNSLYNRPGSSFYPNSIYNSYNRPFLSGSGIGGYDSGYYYNRPGSGCYGSVGCSGAGYPGTGLGFGTNYLGGYNY